jgi:hypothetical protein
MNRRKKYNAFAEVAKTISELDTKTQKGVGKRLASYGYGLNDD